MSTNWNVEMLRCWSDRTWDTDYYNADRKELEKAYRTKNYQVIEQAYTEMINNQRLAKGAEADDVDLVGCYVYAIPSGFSRKINDV